MESVRVILERMVVAFNWPLRSKRRRRHAPLHQMRAKCLVQSSRYTRQPLSRKVIMATFMWIMMGLGMLMIFDAVFICEILETFFNVKIDWDEIR